MLDSKSGLLPLHSPLLGQSQLLSFPPLTDMLKFSGYPYPIRGRHVRRWLPGPLAAPRQAASSSRCERCYCAGGVWGAAANVLRAPPSAQWLPVVAQGRGPSYSLAGIGGVPSVETTLGRAWPPECRRPQGAFKDSMVH